VCSDVETSHIGTTGLSSYLIDDEGELCPWPFVKWHRHPSWRGDARAFVDSAISDSGFIELRERSRRTYVTLHVADVAVRALIRVVHLISDLSLTRTVICTSPRGTLHRLFRTPHGAATMLIAVLRQRETDEQIFLSRERSIDSMSTSDALAELMRLWSAGRDIMESGHLNETARRLLGGRFALLQLQADDETLAIRDWGRAFGSFDERWVRMSEGLLFEDQPDFRYAAAAVGGYHSAVRSRRPVLDDVDALISRQGGRARIRYRRLIVPVVSQTAPTYVLSTSLEDPSIDLRLRGGHEGE
jgi:hypothetical protein